MSESPKADYIKDTIAARATAPGKGGIGIIRVSGPLVNEVAVAVLGNLPEPRLATVSDFVDEAGTVLDTGLALYFPAPHSFTGEDILELQGHGGPVVLDMLLNRIVSLGVRHAGPGEFSLRAFLNDKLDLAQAEAIADLIDSGTEAAAKGAIRSLQGEFSRKIDDLLKAVIELRVFVEAAIDFPEEEVDFLEDENVSRRLDDVAKRIVTVLNDANQGAILTEGASVVIAGKPNAGKSSLMNSLTGRDTSIVTDIPGTTRDVVDELVHLDEIPLRLVDTAGLRNSTDAIEEEGVRRAVKAIDQADLTIVVIEATLSDEIRSTHLDEIRTELGANDFTLVLNKLDLVSDRGSLKQGDFTGALEISAKTGEGLEDLKSHLKAQLGYDTSRESGYTARRRHITALQNALEAVAKGQAVLAESRAGELLAEELRTCQQALSEITGAFTADDLLGEIFASFCIGK